MGERHARIARASDAEGRVVEVGERRVDQHLLPSADRDAADLEVFAGVARAGISRMIL
ncbi:hypothetical protein [Saccharopolyspora shandongensis]|uniref:hypothetical protein n=1 Tax=Saccharopolyspora shandongensis TaxID=418495 RepID=UPI0033CDBFA1